MPGRRNMLLASSSSSSWPHREVTSSGYWFLLASKVKCLLKEVQLQQERRALPRGDFLSFPEWAATHTTSFSPEDRAQIDFTAAQIRLFPPHLPPGCKRFSHRPRCSSPLVHRSLITSLLSPVGLNGRTGRSGVQLTIRGVGKNRLRELQLESLFSLLQLVFVRLMERLLISLWRSSISTRREKIKTGRSDSESETYLWIVWHLPFKKIVLYVR